MTTLTIDIDNPKQAEKIKSLLEANNVEYTDEQQQAEEIQAFAKTKTSKPLHKLTNDEKEDIYFGWLAEKEKDEPKEYVCKEELNREFGFHL